MCGDRVCYEEKVSTFMIDWLIDWLIDRFPVYFVMTWRFILFQIRTTPAVSSQSSLDRAVATSSSSTTTRRRGRVVCSHTVDARATRIDSLASPPARRSALTNRSTTRNNQGLLWRKLRFAPIRIGGICPLRFWWTFEHFYDYITFDCDFMDNDMV